MFCVEAANFRQIGRDDGNAHREVLVQLGRIDVGGVVGQQIRNNSDVEPLDVSRHIVVRPLAQPVQVGNARCAAHVHLRRPHEGERRVGHLPRDVGDELEIHPLMNAADVTDDGTLQGRKVRRDLIGGRMHLLKFLEAHAERKQMDARA